MERQIGSALISVFYKDGLEPIIEKLHELGVKLYSTGGTQSFIEEAGIPCTSVESVTSYPSILGGRVKTLHPKVFGGILARRDSEEDKSHVAEYDIPFFDLVIVDLYPFEETVNNTNDEKAIIEKIDIGGVSLIRAAAKNFNDVCIVASRNQYDELLELLNNNGNKTSLAERKRLAGLAFVECLYYDEAIADYFVDSLEGEIEQEQLQEDIQPMSLRYGENPHQEATFFGDIDAIFDQLNGKELSYNNLVDVDAAVHLIAEFDTPTFAVIKHTNVCGIAQRDDVVSAWGAALAGDPESAFGGILITNQPVNLAVAEKISELFFEVLIAPSFDADALELLKKKKNRILLQQKETFKAESEFKRILNGTLYQDADNTNYAEWIESGARNATKQEKDDMVFANIVCKHLKSNAIALIKDKQLVGKGAGQTSRIDALRQAIEKSKQFGFDLNGAILASDAFFPFDDCAKMAHEAGINAIIQPGGSVRDNDTIEYCKNNDMALVLTKTRHFKH